MLCGPPSSLKCGRCSLAVQRLRVGFLKQGLISHNDTEEAPPHPLNIEQVPELCAEYGQQLEFRGSNDDALAMFESALSSSRSNSSSIAQAEEEKLSYSTPAAAVADGKSSEVDDDDAIAAREEEEARRAVCLAGVARCTLRSGDLRKGLRLAREAG